MPHSPDRPIQSGTEDRLGRSLFVERLADAVVDPTTERATGLVIGITGEWGSGKTSILNLLTEELQHRHQSLALVRFDPWLISGHEDLTRQFLVDLFRSVAPYISNKRAYVRSRAVLARYLDSVSTPSLRSWLVNALLGRLTRSAPLADIKKAFGLLLSQIKVPIVALIDELDRIPDDEILTTARLIRAIADFPNISYVVAYDAPRVIQALGSGNDERGQSYLQKIVQLQIPIPIVFEDEIKTLYLSELAELMPQSSASDNRLNDLIDLLNSAGSNTPRSIKNITGTYAVLERMVHKEVDPIDLLGYCALVANAPGSVRNMQQNVDSFVVDSRDPSLFFQREGDKREAWIQSVKNNLTELTRQPKLWDIITFLFPTLQTDFFFSEEQLLPDAICRRAVLSTVLRLGLVPGAFSGNDMGDLARMSFEDATYFVREVYDDARWDSFNERLRRWLLGNRSEAEIQNVFLSVCRATDGGGTGWPTRFGRQHRLCRYAMELILWSARIPRLKGAAKRLVRLLLEEGRLDIAAGLVRRHFWAYGVFGREVRPDYEELSFLSKDEVVELSRVIGARIIEALDSDSMMQEIYTGQPVFIALDLGLWDPIAKEKLTAFLKNKDALLGIIMMFHTPIGNTERAAMERILDREVLVDHLKKLDSSTLDRDTQACVRIAQRGDDYGRGQPD